MNDANDILRIVLVVVTFLAARLFWRLSHLFKNDVLGPVYQILAYGFLAFAVGHVAQLILDLASVPLDGFDLDLPVEVVFIAILLYGLYRVRNIGEDL
jgi:hypothetical protein